VRPHVRGNLIQTLSPCLEWLFAEAGRPFADRVRAAAAAGFTKVDFWTTSNKDLDGLERAIRDSGVEVTSFVSEPTARIVDPATHDEFVEGVRRSAKIAGRLIARNLIVLSGDELPGVARADQRNAIVEALRRAAPIAADAGVGLVLEPLNTIVDHRGYFLDSTSEGLEIVRLVGEPSVRLLYDVYHSIVMGEDPATVLTDAGELVGHVHIADAPGRHEPGSGTIDWPKQLSALRMARYDGPLGLEYMPLQDTESSLRLLELAFVRPGK
jgi:hydroxypyruvate isomerase